MAATCECGHRADEHGPGGGCIHDVGAAHYCNGFITEADVERRQRDHRHRKAIDLADRLDAFADDVKAWPTTVGKLRQASGSLRWQVRWEEKHDKDVI